MIFPEGHPRPYIRDGVPGLPREEQREVLTKAGVPMHQVFDEKLSGAAVKRRRPEELKVRTFLVEPSRRPGTYSPEVIYVAEFRVLGWSMSDIADVLAKAIRRDVLSVVAVKRERILDLTAGPACVLDALREIDEERRRAAYLLTLAANRAASMKRRNRRWEKLKREIEPLWGADPDSEGWMKGEDIAFKFGFKSVNTIVNHIGTRGETRERLRSKANGSA